MTQAPGFTEHPQRREVVGEMHLRRFPEFVLPAQLVQLVRIVDRRENSEEQLAVAALPGLCDTTSERHREGRWSPDVGASWERHSEASTVTVTMVGTAARGVGWDRPPTSDAAAALRWAETVPGSVIRATRLIVVASDEDARSPVDAARFRQSHLVSCHVAGGARIWSDFQIHEDGYGRIVIAANTLPTTEVISCVQRLQELGNYRNLALIGLAAARAAWTALDEIEMALSETGRALRNGKHRDDDLLAALTAHSERLLSIAAETDFRMSATAAYAEIAAERLQELQPQPIKGFQSLTDFTSRRFNPAVRTCTSLSRRLALLNGRASQFTSLLRTRIDTHIENQNARLLASMERSTRMQLRLQHVVEGLSAVAISYYLLGLIAYPIKAAEHVLGGISSTSVLGLAAPLIVLVVWAGLQIMRRRLFSEGDRP
ncbi:DUF3422 domain-containing protein [Sphingomonas sp. So64.6b]|uniref:DUF3422 domain-containing protein n=1 Tax=Sphingomonas sp. So64.6b TaxID=2997354 RepID=UPI001602B1EC|nr:DUF3422 domain-containing protein [Sphingomonas sp. So64.6b]QNA86342.1 DUF3422 domain-containing protein [Sphingomonas sp. So64.6b]